MDAKSSIVRTFALQGLTDLTAQEPSLTPIVLDLLMSAERNGTPAMKARSRKLLHELNRRTNNLESRRGGKDTSAFGNSGLTKDSKGAIEAGFRGCFRCHVFRSPKDFYAERIVVVDALQRLQEAGQVDDTFAG